MCTSCARLLSASRSSGNMLGSVREPIPCRIRGTVVEDRYCALETRLLDVVGVARSCLCTWTAPHRPEDNRQVPRDAVLDFGMDRIIAVDTAALVPACSSAGTCADHIRVVICTRNSRRWAASIALVGSAISYGVRLGTT